MNEIRETLKSSAQGKDFFAFREIYNVGSLRAMRYWIIGLLLLAVVVLFLPWTQNIRAKGIVTTLRQEQRPQELNAVIAGRVVKWYVKEGDMVKAGDTIARLAEV